MYITGSYVRVIIIKCSQGQIKRIATQNIRINVCYFRVYVKSAYFDEGHILQNIFEIIDLSIKQFSWLFYFSNIFDFFKF